MTSFALPTHPTHRLAGRALAAVAFSIVINAAVVWFLITLYIRPVPKHTFIEPIHTVMLSPSRSPDPQPEDQPDEQPVDQPVTINLDAPAPQVQPPQPMLEPLNLPSPTIGVLLPATPSPHVDTPHQSPAPSRRNPPPPPLDADRVDQPPHELAGNAYPIYPDRQRRLGIEADVTVKLLIDEIGRVTDVRIVQGRSGFNQAVLAALHQWRFTPARQRGRAVKVWAIKVIHFRLED